MLVDTKFEFGYAQDANGQENLIYMDEVGTPDSSRIWDAIAYRSGSVVENSKEEFRQALLRHVNDPRLLLDYSASRSETLRGESRFAGWSPAFAIEDVCIGG